MYSLYPVAEAFSGGVRRNQAQVRVLFARLANNSRNPDRLVSSSASRDCRWLLASLTSSCNQVMSAVFLRDV